MKITKWDPFGGMLHDEYFGRDGRDDVSCNWMPAVDVYETETRIVLSAELPGINQEDIELTMQEGVLTLKGARRPVKDVQQENYHVVERHYGGFCRRFSMPCEVDMSKITAVFKDGVLTVDIPKTNSSRKINVELSR